MGERRGVGPAVWLTAFGLLMFSGCAVWLFSSIGNDQRALRARYDALSESEVEVAEKAVQAAQEAGVVHRVVSVGGQMRVELGAIHQQLMWEERQRLAVALSVYGYRRLGTDPEFTARDARTNRVIGSYIVTRGWSEVGQ